MLHLLPLLMDFRVLKQCCMFVSSSVQCEHMLMHYCCCVILLKVARLLLAVDKGQLHEYRGKSLDSIDVDGVYSRYCYQLQV